MSQPRGFETPETRVPGQRFELAPTSAALRVALETLEPRGGRTTVRLARWQLRSNLYRATP